MATAPKLHLIRGNPDYPTGDGKPVTESDYHWNVMRDVRLTLQAYFAADPLVYISGNIFVFYVPGDRRRHVSPDVLVVKGVPKGDRLNYLIWEEGRSLDLVIELTSTSTRHEDLNRKFKLYRDTVKVPEYFLFDPRREYLEPRLQGYRLRKGEYHPIQAIKGRLPSRVLGLHLEAHEGQLRLYDPATDQWLLTPLESLAQEQEARVTAEKEIERLRREVAELRRKLRKED